MPDHVPFLPVNWNIRPCGCPEMWPRHQWYCELREHRFRKWLRRMVRKVTT